MDTNSNDPPIYKPVQSLTSFPNQNNKHIDHVISYKYDFDDEKKDTFQQKEKIRNNFIEKLKKEGIEIYTIRNKEKDHYHVFHLMFCSMERLLEEAERVKLEMKISNTYIRDNSLSIANLEFAKNIKKLYSQKTSSKVDKSGNIAITTPFNKSMQFLFHKCDAESLKGNGPFSTNTRSLLVHNILKNLDFRKEIEKNKKKKKSENEIENSTESNDSDDYTRGLAFMLHDNYFDDAFILHDPTDHHFLWQTILDYIISFNEKDDVKLKSNVIGFFSGNTMVNKDVRKRLNSKWAGIGNLFKVQPISIVRYYFGELFTFYFAWVGAFIYSLYIPTLVGIVFFIIGLVSSIREANNKIYNTNTTSLSTSDFGEYYLSVFTSSFDNVLTPIFALILSIWGAAFSIIWQRKTAKLAFDWDVCYFESDEPDLPEYIRHVEMRKAELENKSQFVKYLWNNERIFKVFISYCILIFMVIIVGCFITLSILFRMYMNIKVFPNNSTAQLFFGGFGSSIINCVSIVIMNAIYDIIAKKLTKWENYRTKTEYDDALIYKLFTFEFVNCYGSLFYLSYFRNIDYPNGMFSLGKEFQDRCADGNCMSLLTLQLLIILITKPMPSFIMNVIIPVVQLYMKKYKAHKASGKIEPINAPQSETKVDSEKFNEEIVYYYVASELNKPKSEPTIFDEYMLKILLYGYVIVIFIIRLFMIISVGSGYKKTGPTMVIGKKTMIGPIATIANTNNNHFKLFGSSFFLGPLILILTCAIDLRVDALRSIWLYRRPIGHRAQDIGSWFNIIQFLNVIGIINNAFLIGFVSVWSKLNLLNNKTENRLIFILAFEHVVFLIWLAINICFPKSSQSVESKKRLEKKTVKEIMTTVRMVKDGIANSLYTLRNITGNILNNDLKEKDEIGTFIPNSALDQIDGDRPTTSNNIRQRAHFVDFDTY